MNNSELFNYLFVKNLKKNWLKFSILSNETFEDKNGKILKLSQMKKLILNHYNEKNLYSLILNNKIKNYLLYIIIRLFLKLKKINYKINYHNLEIFDKSLGKKTLIINQSFKKIYFLNEILKKNNHYDANIKIKVIDIHTNKERKIKIKEIYCFIPKRF